MFKYLKEYYDLAISWFGASVANWFSFSTDRSIVLFDISNVIAIIAGILTIAFTCYRFSGYLMEKKKNKK